jgi:hypothetical protein
LRVGISNAVWQRPAALRGTLKIVEAAQFRDCNTFA